MRLCVLGAPVSVSAIEACLYQHNFDNFYDRADFVGNRRKIMNMLFESERARIQVEKAGVELVTRNHALKTARVEGFPEDVEKLMCGWLSQSLVNPTDVRRIIEYPEAFESYNPGSDGFWHSSSGEDVAEFTKDIEAIEAFVKEHDYDPTRFDFSAYEYHPWGYDPGRSWY